MATTPLALKIGLLLGGIFSVPLGSMLIALDSHFHFTSDLERLKQESPDWIIARHFFDSDGFGVFVHRAMAFILFVTTVVWIYSVSAQKTNVSTEYYPAFSKAVLIIILGGIVTKGFILGQSGAVAFA